MESTSAGMFVPLLSVGSKFVNSFKRHTEDTMIYDMICPSVCYRTCIVNVLGVHRDLCMFLCGRFTLHMLPGYLELDVTVLFASLQTSQRAGCSSLTKTMTKDP